MQYTHTLYTQGPHGSQRKTMLEQERTKVLLCNWSSWHHHSQSTPSPWRHMGHTDHQSSASSLSGQRSISARKITRVVLWNAMEGSTSKEKEPKNPSPGGWEEGGPKRGCGSHSQRTSSLFQKNPYYCTFLPWHLWWIDKKNTKQWGIENKPGFGKINTKLLQGQTWPLTKPVPFSKTFMNKYLLCSLKPT